MTDAERDEAIRLLARVVEALVQDVWTCDPVWVATIDLGRDVLKQLADLATEGEA